MEYPDYIYNFVPNNEINTLFNDLDKYQLQELVPQIEIKKLANGYEDIKHTGIKIRITVSKIRPIIGEELFLLYLAYSNFILRSSFLLFGQLSDNKCFSWQTDKTLVDSIKSFLDPKELDIAINNKYDSYNFVCIMFESKIVNKIHEFYTGENQIKNAINQTALISTLTSNRA